jgi:hypothetical protein
MSRSSRLLSLTCLCMLGSVYCASRSNRADSLPMPPPAEEPPLSAEATTGPDAGAASQSSDTKHGDDTSNR